MSVALSNKFLFLFTLQFIVESRSLIINYITLLLHFCGPKWPYTILKNILWKQIVIFALCRQQLYINDTKCCYFCPKSPHLWLSILYDWVTVPAVFVIIVSKTTKITNCSRYKKKQLHKKKYNNHQSFFFFDTGSKSGNEADWNLFRFGFIWSI